MSYSNEFLSDLNAYTLDFSEIAWSFQKFWSWSWATSFLKLLSNFTKSHIWKTKPWWATDKMKLSNFTFNFFAKFKQNAKKVGYKRPNPIKTRWDKIKWNFEKIEVFNFFWKKVEIFKKISKKVEKIWKLQFFQSFI